MPLFCPQAVTEALIVSFVDLGVGSTYILVGPQGTISYLDQGEWVGQELPILLPGCSCMTGVGFQRLPSLPSKPYDAEDAGGDDGLPDGGADGDSRIFWRSVVGLGAVLVVVPMLVWMCCWLGYVSAHTAAARRRQMQRLDSAHHIFASDRVLCAWVVVGRSTSVMTPCGAVAGARAAVAALGGASIPAPWSAEAHPPGNLRGP